MRPKARPGWGLLAALAIRDLWHDRQVSLCIVAALVAVIAPLLLLFGLKHGVVSQLRGELLGRLRRRRCHGLRLALSSAQLGADSLREGIDRPHPVGPDRDRFSHDAEQYERARKDEPRPGTVRRDVDAEEHAGPPDPVEDAVAE